MWGRLSGTATLCGYTITLEKLDGSLCRYQRRSSSGRLEASIIAPCGSIEVWPLPPIFYPERITGYVMVRLREPITARSGDALKLTLQIGFDVGVMVGEHIIDVFPSTGKGKYALYGSPTKGILVRYLEADIAPENGAGMCKALLEVEILNKFTQPATVGRIVFPVVSPRLEVGAGSQPVYPRVRVVVTSSYTAVVNVSSRPTRGEGKFKSLQRSLSIVMSHGL